MADNDPKRVVGGGWPAARARAYALGEPLVPRSRVMLRVRALRAAARQ